jgi:hypothetical protein
MEVIVMVDFFSRLLVICFLMLREKRNDSRAMFPEPVEAEAKTDRRWAGVLLNQKMILPLTGRCKRLCDGAQFAVKTARQR